MDHLRLSVVDLNSCLPNWTWAQGSTDQNRLVQDRSNFRNLGPNWTTIKKKIKNLRPDQGKKNLKIPDWTGSVGGSLLDLIFGAYIDPSQATLCALETGYRNWWPFTAGGDKLDRCGDLISTDSEDLFLGFLFRFFFRK